MKVKQTYKTAAITAVFLLIWMVSGSLVEEEANPLSESALTTLSSVTVLNSNAILKSKTIRTSGFTEADKFIQVRAEIGGRVIKLIDFSEYKRRQAPLGVKITPRGFGKDRRYPITNKFFK